MMDAIARRLYHRPTMQELWVSWEGLGTQSLGELWGLRIWEAIRVFLNFSGPPSHVRHLLALISSPGPQCVDDG